MKIYPLKLKSVLKDAIWGGTQLSEKYGLGTKGQKIAEAWTLTLRKDGESIIENGEYAGKTLSEYADEIGMDKLCGESFLKKNPFDFPLLVKLIDAAQPLSVQVHPDDEYAHSVGIEMGKTEMWYIVDSAPESKLIIGLKKDSDINSAEFSDALKNGNISEYFNYVAVKPGDIYYIPAGLVHAIGKGILIAEIQQNSNTTYRIYDYNRLGIDGKPRELHLKNARETIKNDFSNDKSKVINRCPEIFGIPQTVVDSEYFNTSVLKFANGGSYAFKGGKMTHIMCVAGNGGIEYNDGLDNQKINLSAAQSVLVPCSFGSYNIYSDSNADFIISSVE